MIVRVRGAVWLSVPDVPAIVTVVAPFRAVFATDSVTMLTPVVPEGATMAVTPEGSPCTENATAPLNPLVPTARTVADPLAPWEILRLGVMEIA